VESQLRHRIAVLREWLKEESIRLYNKNWTKIIEKLGEIYTDPARFWKKIRQSSGGKPEPAPYIIDKQNG